MAPLSQEKEPPANPGRFKALTTDVLKSKVLKSFIKSIVPHSTAEEFLDRQKLTKAQTVSVAGVVLFDDEPQVYLPKASIKIYRYETMEEFGTRDHLKGDPVTIEGCCTQMISEAVEQTASMTESISVLRAGKLQRVKYPREAIHEIITNAVIHRDYSLADNIHVRIFDNRIEIQSPGKLPGYVTVDNIRKERFSRNGQIVRLVNKFPDPPNKDVGEGMNTAFEFMEKLQLKPPIVQEDDNSVTVILRHETLARPESIILSFLQENEEVNNKTARELTGIGSENKVKNIFKKMMDEGLIRNVKGKRGNKTAYEITDAGKAADTTDVD